MARVLVVDDTERNRALVRGALGKFSELEIVEADSGDRAFETIQSQGSFDLLITDLRMTNGTGIELLRRLRKTGTATKKGHCRDRYHRGRRRLS